MGVDEQVRAESVRIYRTVAEANGDLVRMWREHEFLQPVWWMNLALAVLPWVIWFRVRPKASADRLLYAGFVALIMASYLNFFGTIFGAWVYTVHLVPTVPSYAVWDFSLYPVATMLFLQARPQASPIGKAFAFASTATLLEVLFTWLDWYRPIRWAVLYSFAIHLLTYLIAAWFARRTGFAPLGSEGRQGRLP